MNCHGTRPTPSARPLRHPLQIARHATLASTAAAVLEDRQAEPQAVHAVRRAGCSQRGSA